MTDDQQTCKVTEYCRLCLEGPGCIDIYDTHLLSQNIFSVIGVEVCITDKLPRTVCKSCFEIVNSASQLQIIARKNDSHLKELTNAIHHMNGTNTNEENIHQTGSEDAENCDSQPHNSTSVEFFQPTIIKVRSDLFRESVSQEILEEKCIVKNNSMNIIRDSKEDIQCNTEYKCDLCSKVFETRKKLYCHSRLHNKTRECPVYKCGKKFATKGDLEKHKRTHTGEKPFVCTFCDRGFSQGGTLKAHMESVHGMCKVEVRENFFIK